MPVPGALARWLLAGALAAASALLNPAAADAPAVPASGCLPSGDGYFRAQLAGAVDAKIDWPNSGTRCLGEPRTDPAGVRLSFRREGGGQPDFLFVLGLSGVRRGQPARAVGTNLTLILQGTNRIFGTLGDARCTVDTLAQQPVTFPGVYRIEARGFCTQPAHAIRGNGAVLVSTFEFAGLVNYGADDAAATAGHEP